MIEESARRDIVVIGGSSGSIDAMRNMMANTSVPPSAAMFVVMHLPPHGLPILASMTSMANGVPVVVAEHGLPIKHGQIYLAPPDHHLLLDQGVMLLGRGPRENMSRPAIDALFRSAAVNYGPRVVGVVLSGMLNDGAAGAHAIKRCGGAIAVQEPADAVAGDMPSSAIAACSVDVIAPAAQLGDVLTDLLREPAGWPVPIPADLRLEVDIAAGSGGGSEAIERLADPVPLTCPACGGVVSQLRSGGPLRYRCQVGHAMTAEVMAAQKEGDVDEALRLALRVIEERAELVARMAREGESSRPSVAAAYAERAREYRRYAQTLRQAVIRTAELTVPAPD